MDQQAFEKLEAILGVRFKHPEILKRALTHRSAAVDDPFQSNERLEFLGDSVVGIVVCENLFRLYPGFSEGDLAKSKAYIVSEHALADAAMRMGLEEFVVMSAGEAASGGRRRRSILSDALEAVVAAVYLDCGIVAARRVVRTALQPAITDVVSDAHRLDYKSSLQEWTQAAARRAPTYLIIGEAGQDHDKTFTSRVYIGDLLIGEGIGKSKKEAEQAAAYNALDHFDERYTAAHPPPEGETDC